MACSRILVALLFVSASAWAQKNRYMVFFSDKTGTPHSLSTPSTFLSERALDRRTKGKVEPVNEEDLPVVPSYVTQVRATGAEAFFTTRWMNGVLVEATAAELAAIQLLPFVASTEFVAANHRLLGGRKGWISKTQGTSAATDEQLSMLGIDSMHADGYRGEGIRIAVFDSGFPGVESVGAFQSLRNDGRIVMTQDFITNSGNVYQFDDHGTNVLSIMAATTTNFTGGAPDAEYLLFVTEDVATEFRVEEYNWLFAAEQADSAGADIIQSSLGYFEFDDPAMNYTYDDLDGNTAIVSLAAKKALERAMVVVVSAGNEGGTEWQRVTPPADTPGVVAVGAISSSGVRAPFSSFGPVPTGIFKPDVVALGVSVSSIAQNGSLNSVSGTSAAAPLVTSLAAGLLQRFYDSIPHRITSAMVASASNSATPNDEIGFGIPGYFATRNLLEVRYGPDAYPNPATTTLWLTFAPPTVGEIDQIAIFDMQGKVVMMVDNQVLTWNNSTEALDVSGLAAGIYILRLIGKSATFTYRFVKL